jgi:hypothetical protein
VKLSSLASTAGFKLSALYSGLFMCSFVAIGTMVYLLTTHSLEQQHHTLEYGVLDQDGQLLAGKSNQFKLTAGWQIIKLDRFPGKAAEKAVFLIFDECCSFAQSYLARCGTEQ